MGLLRGVKGVIYKADLLDSGSLLRVKGEPEHKTLLGGVLSITVMIVLVAAFYNRIIDTLDKVLITSSSSTTNSDDPSPFNVTTIDKGNFMFAVEVWHHNLNEGSRYFDIVLANDYYVYGQPQPRNTTWQLQPCTLEHWNGYPDVQASYDKLNMSYWKCLPKDSDFEIKGKYSSPTSKTLSLSVKICTNNSLETRPCAPQSQIDQFFANTTINFFTIYFINPLINPDEQQFLSYYLEDTNYIIFSPNGGEQGLLYVQDYTIETDESILPNSNIQAVSGGYIPKTAIKNSFSAITDTYATYIIYKSATSTNITRSFQKLDNVLSYIGGLFGTIIMFFFLISSYNTYKFEVSLAGYLYRAEQKQKIEENYNFLYFLAQLFYSLLGIFRVQPQWEKVSRFHKIREEMLKQLDILYLIKRVNFLERAITLLFSEQQLKGMHLASQTTMEEAVKTRRNYRLKSRIKQQFDMLEKARNFEKNDIAIKQPISNNTSHDANNEFLDFESAQKLRKPGKKAVHPHVRFDCDNYSSDDTSSQEDQQILNQIQHLRKEDRDSLDHKIWKNIDDRIKLMVEKSLHTQLRQLTNEFQEEDSNYKNRIMNIRPLQINDFANRFIQQSSEQESKNEDQCGYAKGIFQKLKTLKVRTVKSFQGEESSEEKR